MNHKRELEINSRLQRVEDMSEAIQTSLSGWLTVKATGAFRFVMPDKRLWFVFNEKGCYLESYLSEDDSLNKKKMPITRISLIRATILENFKEEHQFIVL